MCLGGKWEIKLLEGLEFSKVPTLSMALTLKRGSMSRRQRAYSKFVVEVQTLNGHISAMS